MGIPKKVIIKIFSSSSSTQFEQVQKHIWRAGMIRIFVIRFIRIPNILCLFGFLSLVKWNILPITPMCTYSISLAPCKQIRLLNGTDLHTANEFRTISHSSMFKMPSGL